MTKPTSTVCPIFQGFTYDEYESVLSLLEQKSYRNRDVILHEGESERSLWILVKGTCEVVKLNKGNSERLLATLEAGAVFGEMSFFQAAPHSATVRASAEVEVMRLTREKYDQLYLFCPQASYKIAICVVSLMAQRLRSMDDWVCNFIERAEGADHREEWHDFRSKLYADWQF